MKKINCICQRGENHPSYKHGHTINGSPSRLWRIWQGMIVRTTNKNRHDYKYYGARGIKVCDLWFNSETFIKWALKNGYQDNLTIDRINGEWDYCPENCRWITIRENIMNRPKKTGWGVYFNGNGYFVRIRRYSKYYYGGFSKDINMAISLRDKLISKIESSDEKAH